MELPQGDSEAVGGPGAVECLLCWAQLTGVSPQARFCPRCGGELAGRGAVAAPVAAPEPIPALPISVGVPLADEVSALEPEYWSLRAELEAHLSDASPPPVASSFVMLAYANALLKLGWRYAHGHGVNRNESEAERCYAKAGRLSEAWGKGR